MAAVEKLCQRGIVLHRGQVVFQGDSKEAIEDYLHNVWGEQDGRSGSVIELVGVRNRRSRVAPLLKRLEFSTSDDRSITGGLQIGAALRIRVHFMLDKAVNSFDVGLGCDNSYGQRVFTAHSLFEPNRTEGEFHGPQVFVCDIPALTIMPGEYSLRVWLDLHSKEADHSIDAARVSVIESDYYGTGKAPWNGAFVLQHHWHLEAAVAEVRHPDSLQMGQGKGN
jgi:lipopolysaccharide transport system ATP-binding protein